MPFATLSSRTLALALVGALALPVRAQWTAGASGTANDLNTTWRIGADIVLVGGVGGTLLRSTDGGASFSPAAGGFFDDVNEMQFVDDLNGYAVADNGRFLTTADAGATWAVSFLPTGSNLAGLHFRDALNGHVVGRDGVIFRTVDGGANWTAQSSGTAERLESVFFTDANTGFIAGRNDSYLSTTDGGATWNLSTLLGTGRDLNDVFFTDAVTGYIATDNGILARTLDGGATWTTQFTGTVQNLNEVFFLDAMNGYLAGDGGVIRSSTDGGATWVAEASGTTANLEDVHFSLMGRGASAGALGTVVVRNDALPCAAPVSGLSAAIGTTDVAFSWDAQPGATAYQIQGGQVGAAPQRKTVPTNAFSLGGGAFVPGASYNWRVRAVCGAAFGPYSAIDVFTVPVLRTGEAGATATAYPNPAADRVTVTLPEGHDRVRLLGLDGRVLLDEPAAGHTHALDLGTLPAGTYLLLTEGPAGSDRLLLQHH